MLKDDRRDLISNYQSTFSSPHGQRVLEDLKLRGKYAEPLYSSKQTTEELHYLMGRQSIIMDILFIISMNSNEGDKNGRSIKH